MKRMVKIALIAFLLIGVVIPQSGCSSNSNGTGATEGQITAVQRGDLTVEITAAGNLALSRTEDIAFDLFYPEGTVGEVLVEEGDIVEEGQVLAKVDTEEWADELSTLEDQVTTKERDLLQAQINLLTAEQNLKSSQDNKAAKELALFNAQINLDQVVYNLSVAEETNYAPDLVVAQEDVDKLEAYLQYALENGYDKLVSRFQAELDAAQKKLDAMVQGYDPEEIAIKKKQVEAAQRSLAQAQGDLDKVAADVSLKELQLTLSQGKLEDARKALLDAQEELDKAKSKSPLLVAPFAGFITSVNVEGGDDVMTGTVAVQIADPNRFEADIMVSEMDIVRVKLGGQAVVQVDAMTGLNLPAEITHISPTATIQSGVVNYQVKVEVKPLEELMQQRQAARQETAQNTEPGELPERLQQAVEEGRLTLEQAQEMMAQGQSGQRAAQASPVIPEDFQLRGGLTVTVNILVAEKENVLLVPNNAITRQGDQTYVQVSTGGITEKRSIQTGISDWQYTEVVGGLSEGEQVVVPQSTTTTTTQQQGSFRGPMPFIGPPGR